MRIATAEEIRDEVSRLIHEDPDVIADGIVIKVPLPLPHETDAEGRTWDIRFLDEAGGHEACVREIVADLRLELQLVM